MITTPIRFFHKEAGLRVEAVETPLGLCGGEDDPCKCALFSSNCRGVCLSVNSIFGCNVYFKKVD